MFNSFFALLLIFASGSPALDWLSWGGPNANFTVDGKALPASFGEGIPKVVWRRSLGDGFSSMVTDGNLLYTMYRRGNQEVVVAIVPATGKTRWEYAYDAAFLPGMVMENGSGPHATPLIFDGKVYTIGVLGNLHALDKKNGKILWRKDLFQHFPVCQEMVHGFAVSPIAYKNMIVVKPGDPEHSMLALNPKDGSVIWEKKGFTYSPATPILIDVDGQQQLLAAFKSVIAAFNPENGDLLWMQPPPSGTAGTGKPHRLGLTSSTPVWGLGNLLFASSAGNGHGSSTVLHLSQSGGKTTVEEIWYNSLIRVQHSNTLRIGDYVYGSSGDAGPSPLTAVNIKTGEVAWRDRMFGKANMLLAGDKVILLDEGGNLARVTLSPEGLKVRWNVQLLQGVAWTSPMLLGTKLYIRDRQTIMALEMQ